MPSLFGVGGGGASWLFIYLLLYYRLSMSAKIKPSFCVIFADVNCLLFSVQKTPSVGVRVEDAGDHADAIPVGGS